jgi:hypothetical protein
VGAYKRKKVWILSVVTHTFWFDRFMTGLHRRVGEIKKQDWPIPIGALHEVDKVLEEEWSRAATLTGQKRISEMGVWYTSGFTSGL